MISLQLRRLHTPPQRREGGWWSVLAAVGLTWASIGGMSLAWSRAHSAATSSARPTPETLVLMPLRRPTPVAAPRVAPKVPPGQPRTLRASDVDRPIPPMARDTAAVAGPAPAAIGASAPSAVSGAMSPSLSTRLHVPHGPGTPWYVPPRAHDPFAPAPQLSESERDSALVALGTQVPELAARRVPSQSERDARAKEAMLKMRLAGRILLVPPDNSGGLITSSLPLPIFSGGPSRAKRRRDSVAVAADRAIQERLRQRADSLGRVRADSIRNRRPDGR